MSQEALAYEADLTEAGGLRKGTWSCLIRVDSAGARKVEWARVLPEGARFRLRVTCKKSKL